MSADDLDLLREFATEDPATPGNWILRVPSDALRPVQRVRSGTSRPADATAAYIRSCLYLGLCVSDVMTTDLVTAIASRLHAIEAAVCDRDGLS